MGNVAEAAFVFPRGISGNRQKKKQSNADEQYPHIHFHPLYQPVATIAPFISD
jgi:hypothetical protein